MKKTEKLEIRSLSEIRGLLEAREAQEALKSSEISSLENSDIA